jgi:hypothetical protein
MAKKTTKKKGKKSSWSKKYGGYRKIAGKKIPDLIQRNLKRRAFNNNVSRRGPSYYAAMRGGGGRGYIQAVEQVQRAFRKRLRSKKKDFRMSQQVLRQVRLPAASGVHNSIRRYLALPQRTRQGMSPAPYGRHMVPAPRRPGIFTRPHQIGSGGVGSLPRLPFTPRPFLGQNRNATRVSGANAARRTEMALAARIRRGGNGTGINRFIPRISR